MDFQFTPEEARTTAEAVAGYLKDEGFRVDVEVAFLDAPYRPTLTATSAGLTVLVEAQGTLNYGAGLQDLARWLSAGRHYCELSIAIGLDASIAASSLKQLQADGVGLMLAGEEVDESHRPRNPALVVTPEPTLALGRCATPVKASLKKFNAGERKNGLQELCELVEKETDTLIVKAARKGMLTKGEAEVQKLDWASQINFLASNIQYVGGGPPLINDDLKNDLQSFRGARNLIDHKVRSKHQERQRQRQFTERAMMAPRLTADLLALQRRVK